MIAEKPLVLLVERDATVRERIGGWLDSSGFDVIQCPGPTAPDYGCIGARTYACPLASGADVVVLDTWLGGDAAFVGTTAVELLSLYTANEKPVVALTRRCDEGGPFTDDDVASLSWPVDRREVCETVAAVIERSQTS